MPTKETTGAQATDEQRSEARPAVPGAAYEAKKARQGLHARRPGRRRLKNVQRSGHGGHCAGPVTLCERELGAPRTRHVIVVAVDVP